MQHAGACTSNAEAFFSRLRRGERGHHHHIAGPYLVRYAQEAAWREDLRRASRCGRRMASSAWRCEAVSAACILDLPHFACCRSGYKFRMPLNYFRKVEDCRPWYVTFCANDLGDEFSCETNVLLLEKRNDSTESAGDPQSSRR
jgi:hypothetical protein